MKMNFYELFDDGSVKREETKENVRVRTLRRLEQSQAAPRPVRLLTRIGVAAAVVAVLVGGAIAGASVWNAMRALEVRQGGRVAVIDTKNGVAVREGYLEISPQITVSPNAPKTVERYYVPSICADWMPQTQFYDGQNAPTMQTDARFAWTLPDGQTVVLRQLPLSGYRSDYGVVTVSLGYGADYEITERQFGDYTAQCVAVPPSALDEAHSDPGRQVLFWSDGAYLFTLETDFTTSKQTLAVLFESLTPVDDFTPYVSMEARASEEAADGAAVQTPLFPTEVPAGWELSAGSGVRQDGAVWLWVWSYEGENGLLLEQRSDASAYELEQMDWAASTEVLASGRNDQFGLS